MSFSVDGYELVNDFIKSSYIEAIKLETNKTKTEFKDIIGGVRNAEKQFESVYELLELNTLSKYAESYLGKESNFVRAILFDKTPKNNWLVTWHQDRTIAVSSRKNINGWGPWSIKDGCYHVQPGVDVLNNMVTFRLHLDASTAENGCLQVIPKSHQCGIMSKAKIDRFVQRTTPVHCVARPYSALVMRPLILHSSSKATNPVNRRILHIEYSSYRLPRGLEWA